MKKLIAISVAMIVSASAFATNNDHCYKDACPQEPATTPAPTTTTVNPTANGGVANGTGYGGQANAASAADAISNALAQNDNKFVGELWAKLNASQKTEVANNLAIKLNNDQKNQFSGAVNGTNWTRIGDVGSTSTAAVTGNTLGGGAGGTSASEASGNGAGNMTNIGGTNYQSTSKAYALSLAFTIPGHSPAPASTPAPQVGVVTSGTCVPSFDGDKKAIRSAIDYENGTTIEVHHGNGKSTVLEGIVKEEIIHGTITLAGFGADTKAEAKSESGAGGALSIFGSTGKSGSEAVGTTGFKTSGVPCVYRTNYYRAPVTKPVTTAEAPKPEATAMARSDAQAELLLERDKVPGKVIGHRLIKKANTCNGKPIPEGMACVAVRKEIDVLTDAEIKLTRVKAQAQAKAEALAEAKKP